MITQEIANQWHSFCQKGQNLLCIETLYADDVISTEMPGMPGEVLSGKQDVLQKNKEWFDSIEEWHTADVTVPVVAGNHFTSKLSFDATFKERGRLKIEEIGVYEVKDGKICKERFFYPME